MKLLFDITTTLGRAYDPPTGTTRVERIVLADLIEAIGADNVTGINHDRGRFVAISPAETELMREIAASPGQQAVPAHEPQRKPPAGGFAATGFKNLRSSLLRRLTPLRRLGKLYLRLFPRSVRPMAAQGAWEIFSGLMITARSIKRSFAALVRRRPAIAGTPLFASAYPSLSEGKVSVFDATGHTDLITLGNGWDYLDYERLHTLSRRYGVRVHGFVHDLIAIDRPHLFHDAQRASALHQHYAELCNICTTLICNSYATRESLLRFIAEESLPTPVLTVAQLPVLEGNVAPTMPAADFDLGRTEFILFVSTIEVRKNHLLLIKIWRECLQQGRPLPVLIFVGHHGWGVDVVFKSIEFDPVIAGRVRVMHDLKDEELLWLYDNCLFTLYPSQVEGWGLPIGESLGRGKVCVHAADPAQKEAGQGLMPALHPDDFNSWKETILDLVERPARRVRLEATIRERYRPITPADFCRQVRTAIGVAP